MGAMLAALRREEGELNYVLRASLADGTQKSMLVRSCPILCPIRDKQDLVRMPHEKAHGPMAVIKTWQI